MKKFLALVLALVMTMSLVTISAGADFTDDEAITYGEAVDVMTAIGVVGGYADGSFNPQGTLTRGAAAKIICNMILGPTEAGALATVEAPFSDVPADHVFAGYIAYCVSEGIVSGYSDGTFRPAGTLTGYAFWKMLLGALGYEADIEGYTGANFSINVAKRGLNIGLAKGLNGSFAGAKALTREEACLYAFNALKATMVDYGNKSTITVGDITVTTSAEAKKVEDDGVNDYTVNTTTGDTTMEFCEMYFSNLKSTSTSDAYGRPATQWKNKATKIGTYAETAKLTYTAEVKGTVLADDLDDAGIAAYASTAANTDAISFKIYINGEDCTSWGTYFGTTLVDVADVKAAFDLKTNLPFTGKGFNMEIFADSDGNLTRIVVLTPYLAKITSIEKDSETTRSVDERALNVEFTNYAGNTITLALDCDVTGFDAVYGNVAKGDYVIITPNKGAVDTISAAVDVAIPETVTGPISYVKANSELTMAGATYKATAIYDQVGANFGLTTKDATLYLDANGYVLGYKGPTSSADKSVAVVKVYQTLDADGVLTNMVKGVTSDGATVDWKYETGTVSDGKTPATTVTGASPAPNTLYTYSDLDNDDAKELVAIAVSTPNADATLVDADGDVAYIGTTAVAATSKSATIATSTKGYYADDVKFIFINNGKAIVKDGVQKVASGDKQVVVIDRDEDNNISYIKTVYVLGTAAASSTTSDDIVFVSSADNGDVSVIVDGKEKTFDVFTAYVNGEKLDTFYAASATQYAFYSIEVDDETKAYITANNAYTATTGDIAVKSSLTISAIAGNVATMSDTADYSLSAAKIVDTTTNGNAIDSVAKLQTAIGKGTVTVSMIYDADDNNVAYVYVTGYTAW